MIVTLDAARRNFKEEISRVVSLRELLLVQEYIGNIQAGLSEKFLIDLVAVTMTMMTSNVSSLLHFEVYTMAAVTYVQTTEGI